MDVIQLPGGTVDAPVSGQEPSDNLIQLPNGIVNEPEDPDNGVIQIPGGPISEEEAENPYDGIQLPEVIVEEPTHVVEPPTYTIQLRRGTAAEWTIENPVLRAGEPGYEMYTGRIKIGDGVSLWSELQYIPSESTLATMIEAALADLNASNPELQQALHNHIVSLTPHPVYDDGPSFYLLYQNAKV